MFYRILKVLIGIALKVFYSKISSSGSLNTWPKGPVLIVANHPNTLMDPLLIGYLMPVPLHFIAKSTLFKPDWLGILFKKLHMIPIFRSQDSTNGPKDNHKAFEQCYKFLSKKGSILIFPEGNSFWERRLREMKTGTARIALGFEEQNNFNGGLTILAVGINYTNPHNFRQDVHLDVSEPIKVSNFKEIYLSDPIEAVQQLTKNIYDNLSSLTINTKDVEEDQLLAQIEKIYLNTLMDQLDRTPKKMEQAFFTLRQILDAIRLFEAKHPEKLLWVKRKISSYLNALSRIGLRPSDVLASPPTVFEVVWTSLSLIIGFPFAAWGALWNYLPYRIPGWVADRWIGEEEYVAPAMLLTGIVSFHLFYLSYLYIGCMYLPIVWAGGLLIASGIMGIFSWHYFRRILGISSRLKYFFLRSKYDRLFHSIEQLRLELFSFFEEARNAYIENRDQTSSSSTTTEE